MTGTQTRGGDELMATRQTVLEIQNFVGGRPADAQTDFRLDVLDPASGEVLGRVPLSGPSEVDQAVRVAAKAFQGWQDEPVTRRARRMFGLQVLLERELDQLAELVTRENGKHLDEARGEVRRGIEVVELAAGMTTLMKGETLDQVARGVDVSLHRFPLGVCCGITPFNFPAMIPLWFAPLAIAAGNTFVLKPSQRTPLTANRLAELFAEAGFPDGVFNVVHGAQRAVEGLIDHPHTRAVSFVGSGRSPARCMSARGRAASGSRRSPAPRTIWW
jgi:malonate-semialdehyde dehydrogenase (acetylating)/methylmalonate-semialdehyde dehydrogenase